MEILRTEQITHERWLNLFVRTFRHNGIEGRWCFASRHDGTPPAPSHVDAVVIVPVLVSDGAPPRLVMVREYRLPIGDTMYGFPAGLVDEGESLEAVARRELKEETGLDVIEVLKISPPIYSSAGMTDESSVLVFVKAAGDGRFVQALGASEEIEIVLLDHQQVCDLCDSGARFDGKAWVVVYMFQLLGHLL